MPRLRIFSSMLLLLLAACSFCAQATRYQRSALEDEAKGNVHHAHRHRRHRHTTEHQFSQSNASSSTSHLRHNAQHNAARETQHQAQKQAAPEAERIAESAAKQHSDSPTKLRAASDSALEQQHAKETPEMQEGNISNEQQNSKSSKLKAETHTEEEQKQNEQGVEENLSAKDSKNAAKDSDLEKEENAEARISSDSHVKASQSEAKEDDKGQAGITASQLHLKDSEASSDFEDEDDPAKLTAEVNRVAQSVASKLQKELTTKEKAGNSQAVTATVQAKRAAETMLKEAAERPAFQVSFGTRMVSEQDLWIERQKLVKLAIQEAWHAYEEHALGFDELAPLSLQGINNHGGLSTTLLSSLSTLHMVGLNQEFQRAAAWVASSFSISHSPTVVLADAIQNAVGGLLSAFELSEDTALLEAALGLTSHLLKGFENRVLPAKTVTLNSQNQPEGDTTATLEIGSIQMELVALARHIGSLDLEDLATFPVRFLDEAYSGQGLLPSTFKRSTGEVETGQSGEGQSLLSIGEHAGRFYETLLKMWLLTGKQDDMYKTRWQKAMDEALETLYAAAMDGSVLIGIRQGTRVEPRMTHSTCRMPGLLALGALQGAVDPAKLWFYMDNAGKIMETCWRMYDRTASGLSPEEFHVDKDDVKAVVSDSLANEMWPEAAQSLVFMWRATKDPKFRQMGWGIFHALTQHCKTPSGAFAAVKNVNEVPATLEDKMPAQLIAQTLKHLWLLFGPEDIFGAEWVFSVAGQPIRIPKAPPKNA